DEELPPSRRQGERKRIGVAVRGERAIAERAGVGHQPDLVRRVELAAEHVIAALRERLAQRQARLPGIERGVRLFGVDAEERARLVVERARLQLEVAAAEKDRAGGEKRAVGAEALALGEAHR